MARENYLSRTTVRNGTNSTHDRKYQLDYVGPDSASAMTELVAALPASVAITDPSAPSGFVTLDQFAPQVVPRGAGRWEGSAQYRHKAGDAASDQNENLSEVGNTELSVNMGTENTTLTQAIDQQSFAYVFVDNQGNNVSYPAPEVDNAINATAEGVEGVSIFSPAGTFQYTKVYANSVVVGTNWVHNKSKERCKTNNQPFFGFPIGELLFTQLSLSVRNSGDVEVTFSFAHRPAVTNLHIGPPAPLGVTIPNKGGWQYVWVRYRKYDDGTTTSSIPEGVYLATVYESTNFTSLIA